MRRLAFLLLTATLCLTQQSSAFWQSRDSGYNVNVGTASLSCSFSPNLSATYNVAYSSGTPSASGGTGPYSYSNTGTSFAASGYTLSSSTGAITGTDSTDSGGATYPGIQILVTDNVSATANCGTSFTITVAGGGTSFGIAYGATQTSTTSPANLFTLSSVNIGTPGATSIIAIGFAWNASTTISSVTIGGTSATQAASAHQVSGTTLSTDIWYAAYTGAGSVIVAVQMSGSTGRLNIFPWNITGTSDGFSVANGTSSSGTKTTCTASCPSGTIAVPSGGGTVSVSAFAAGPTAASSTLDTTDCSASSAGCQSSGTLGVNWYYAGHDTSHNGTTENFVTTATSSGNIVAVGSYAVFSP